jgi:3-oxoacyl-[acyl-carrier protein] reductase
MQLLKNKTVLITGGSRGIGKAIVETFCKHGAKVIFTFYKSKIKAKKLIEKYKHINPIYSCKYKANNIKDCELLMNKILKLFNNRIDILVNNIGITLDNILIKMTHKEWDDVINTNLKSIFYITQKISKLMLMNKIGNIINISSIIGATGNIGQTNYATSKYGIIGFTKSISKELASRNIRCNVISPGFIKTNMINKISDKKLINDYINKIPMKRYGSPQEIANVCLFLASNLSSYITGEVIHVTGGLYHL